MLKFVTSQCLNCGAVTSQMDVAVIACPACGGFDIHAYAEDADCLTVIDQVTCPGSVGCCHEDIVVTGAEAVCLDCDEVL